MSWPISHALIKIFGKGFYKEHSGFLLFLFVVIFSHLFWMRPLGGHLTPEETIYHHLIMLISFANDPVMMLFYFVIWLIYSIKSWNYVEKQLKVHEHQFLMYSITSLARVKQFQSWFWVQSVILLPVVIFGMTAVGVGFAFRSYLLPLIIILYLLGLISLGAIRYIWLINRSTNPEAQSLLLKMSSRWKKPFFSLFIYYVFDKLKLSYLLTKLLSFATITGCFLYFSDLKDDLRLSAIVILLVTVTHSFLIYQNRRFEDVYLLFSRNLPYSRWSLLTNFVVVYLTLVLPEILWAIYRFDLLISLRLIALSLSIALMFHSMLFLDSSTVFRYIKNVFALFILYFLMILFGVEWIVIVLNFPLALIIFYKSYYVYERVILKK